MATTSGLHVFAFIISRMNFLALAEICVEETQKLITKHLLNGVQSLLVLNRANQKRDK